MPRCTVDMEFLKSVADDAKAAGCWADAACQLFMQKGKISEYAMRRIQNDESILRIPIYSKYLAETESGEWLNENCTTLEMQLKACQQLCETVTAQLSAVLEECAQDNQKRQTVICLAPIQARKKNLGKKKALNTPQSANMQSEIDPILKKMLRALDEESKKKI